jgi:hypothetical protein
MTNVIYESARFNEHVQMFNEPINEFYNLTTNSQKTVVIIQTHVMNKFETVVSTKS